MEAWSLSRDQGSVAYPFPPWATSSWRLHLCAVWSHCFLCSFLETGVTFKNKER